MLSKLNFITLLLIGFVDYLGIGLVYPVFAALLFDKQDALIPEGASLGYRGAMLGILISLTPLTQFFSSPILGKLSDIKGRKKTLLYGTAIGLFGYVLSLAGIFFHSLTLLFFYRICIGISEGTIAVSQAMIADMSSEKNKTREFAFFNASLGAGFTIGPFLGGKLADPSLVSQFGYTLPFIASGMMCAVNLFLITFQFTLVEKCKNELSINVLENLYKIRKVLFWKQLRFLFFATFAFAFGWSFFNEFIPLLLINRFGFTPNETGNYYAYGGAWYALSAGFLTARLAKYFGPEQIIIKALVGCAFFMLLFLLLQESNFIWWILPPFMACLSAIFPTTGSLVSAQASEKNQGEVMGVYQSVIAAAMGLSPLLGGSLIGMYPNLTSWGGAFAMLLSAFAIYSHKRTTWMKATLRL